MNIGQRINEFDNSEGTIADFNRIFSQCPINKNLELEIEILDIPLNKPYHRNILINGKIIEYNLFPEKILKERKDKGKKREAKRTFDYKLFKNNELIEVRTRLELFADKFEHHLEHVRKVIRTKGEYSQGQYKITRERIKKGK